MREEKKSSQQILVDSGGNKKKIIWNISSAPRIVVGYRRRSIIGLLFFFFDRIIMPAIVPVSGTDGPSWGRAEFFFFLTLKCLLLLRRGQQQGIYILCRLRILFIMRPTVLFFRSCIGRTSVNMKIMGKILTSKP